MLLVRSMACRAVWMSLYSIQVTRVFARTGGEVLGANKFQSRLRYEQNRAGQFIDHV